MTPAISNLEAQRILESHQESLPWSNEQFAFRWTPRLAEVVACPEESDPRDYYEQIGNHLQRLFEYGTIGALEEAHMILDGLHALAADYETQFQSALLEMQLAEDLQVTVENSSDLVLARDGLFGVAEFKGRTFPVVAGKVIREVDGVMIAETSDMERDRGNTWRANLELVDGTECVVRQGLFFNVRELLGDKICSVLELELIGGKLNGSIEVDDFDGYRPVPVVDGVLYREVDGKRISTCNRTNSLAINRHGLLHATVLLCDESRRVPVLDGNLIDTIEGHTVIDCIHAESFDGLVYGLFLFDEMPKLHVFGDVYSAAKFSIVLGGKIVTEFEGELLIPSRDYFVQNDGAPPQYKVVFGENTDNPGKMRQLVTFGEEIVGEIDGVRSKYSDRLMFREGGLSGTAVSLGDGTTLFIENSKIVRRKGA